VVEALQGRVLSLSKGRDLGDVVFLPRAMFDASGELTLDDLTAAAIGERLGVRVEVAGTMGEVAALLCVQSRM
jgi:NifB/MoaA-like Fe-S oxidoreductase